MTIARYKDFVDTIEIGKLYYDTPIVFSMSPRDAIFYEENVSPLIDNSKAGLDIVFSENQIMRYYFCNVYLCVEFPSIDISSGKNIPMFEVYMGSDYYGKDWIARFIPTYNESTQNFYTSSITQEVIDESELNDFFFSPANDEGYIGFTFTYLNIVPWLEAYEYGIEELNSFGIRFYFINPSLDAENVDTQYTVKIKRVSIGTSYKNLPPDDEGGRIIINSSGPGAVYVNGNRIR